MSDIYNGLPFSNIVYFRVKVNGKMELVPMEMNPDGSLKYRSRYVDEFHHEIDSEPGTSDTSLI